MSARPDVVVGAEVPPAGDRRPVPDFSITGAVLPFWLRGAPVRGRLVRPGPLIAAILGRHPDNPPVVNTILAEALVLTAGLAAALKFSGSFSLQARGDGALSMLLADCTEAGALRGYARFDAEKLAALAAEPSAARLLGAGYLAFTCDQGPDMDRYQGIVPLEGATLAELTHAYFRNSEQTDTAVQLFAADTPGGWRAAALILERVAIEGGEGAPTLELAEDAWRAAVALAATLHAPEALDDGLSSDALLRRLFHELAPACADPRPLSHGCRCTRGRLQSILQRFSADDLDHMSELDPSSGARCISMTCEFCNHAFRFDRDAFPR